MKMGSSAVRPFVILVFVNLMWAFQFSGAKIATEELGPITVTFLPLGFSVLLMAPFVLLGSSRRPSKSRANIPVCLNFIALGTVGIIAAQLGLTWGVQRSLASNGSVLTLTIPVLTALMAMFLLKEKMSPLRWLSFALAIIGVLMVSDVDWHSVQLFRSRYLAGNALIFVSCAGSAFYNSYSKKLLEDFSAVEVLVYSFVVSALVLLVLMAIWEPSAWRRLPLLSGSVWLSLGLIAVFSLSASTVLYFSVIEHIDVTRASLSIYLLPVFGVAISAMTLKETITWKLMIGGALVFISTFLVTTYEERRKLGSNRQNA
jgi:drug/metabolite transporter (DMT)-like permease